MGYGAGFAICALRLINIGALLITYTILGIPDYIYSIMGPIVAELPRA